MVLQRKRNMTQSASGSVSVSWDNARVSAAMRERNPSDKMLCFMGLLWFDCLSPFGLGARLAQGVGDGKWKNAQNVRTCGEECLALLSL